MHRTILTSSNPNRFHFHFHFPTPLSLTKTQIEKTKKESIAGKRVESRVEERRRNVASTVSIFSTHNPKPKTPPKP